MLSTFSELNYRKIKIAMSALIWLISLPVFATENKGVVINEIKTVPSSIKNTVKKSTLVIESQVKGSQEQPKVTYIMPWQAIENRVVINTHQQKAVLPKFKPINPKTFKQQATLFHRLNLKKDKSSSK